MCKQSFPTTILDEYAVYKTYLLSLSIKCNLLIIAYRIYSTVFRFIMLMLGFWNLGLQIELSSFSTLWRSFHRTFLFLLPLQVKWRGRLFLSFIELNFKWLLWWFSSFSESDPCKLSLIAIWKSAGEFELCALSLCPINRRPVPVMFTVGLTFLDPVLLLVHPESSARRRELKQNTALLLRCFPLWGANQLGVRVFALSTEFCIVHFICPLESLIWSCTA